VSAAHGLTDGAEAIRWGSKAIELAELVGCVDALIYAWRPSRHRRAGAGRRPLLEEASQIAKAAVSARTCGST
jgi:hypothetical protein